MAATKQFVISLNKLTFPPQKNHHKIVLSAMTTQNQYFIQNMKFVKGHKINFYRERLFISDLATELCFNLYEIDASNNRKLIKSFTGGVGELKEITKRPTTFRLTSDNYELTWDGWLFSENSSYRNQSTEKDYSELDLPFQNQEEEGSKLILANSHSQNSRLNKLISICQSPKKRSSSTDQTPSLTEQPLQFSDDAQNKSQQLKQVELKTKSHLLSRNISSFCGTGEKKKKTHIKSHLYSCLVSGISEFLSPTKP